MGKEIETFRKRHNIYVLSFLSQPLDHELFSKSQDDERIQAVGMRKLSRAWHILTEPWMPYYFAARTSARFALKLIHTVQKYHIDAIHAEYAAMGQYIWIKRLFPHLRFNLIEHDMTAQSFERKVEHSRGLLQKYMRRQLGLIVKKESRYIRKADHVLTFNEKDRRLIKERYGREDVLILNPYFGELDDTEALTKPAELPEIAGSEGAAAGASDVIDINADNRKPGYICFLGQMGRPENHRAAMRLIGIIKEVRKQIPYVQLYIVGNGPSEALKKQEREYIHVTGFVDDVDIYLKQAQLAVFPLEQGAGIKVKVLKAMACGTPVITGRIGAEGIDEEYEVLIHAETNQDYIEKITDCLSGKVDLALVGADSKTFIREHFNWDKSAKTLEKLYP
jgi:glycosyltransferase involved in cell wall biosynthesis